MTPWVENDLKGFYHRAVRQMESMVPKRQIGETWVYPPIWAELEMVGLDEIEVYIDFRQNMIAQYIMIHLIMDLRLEVEQNKWLWLSRWWLEQGALDIQEIRVRHAAAEEGGDMSTDES